MRPPLLPELFRHPQTETMTPQFPSPPAPGDLCSTRRLCEFAHPKYVTVVESHSICPLVSGLLHLACSHLQHMSELYSFPWPNNLVYGWTTFHHQLRDACVVPTFWLL